MTKDKELMPRNARAALAVLVLLPLVAHILFSWIGFTPTDDGFTLAYSRRLLDGEVPHRDFIILRPFFSPLMHVPEVFFGGEYTFWISRLVVWVQLASISWIWVAIVNRLTSSHFSSREKLLVVPIVFAATVHNFPIMAWHTIDGLFLASLGLLLCLRPQSTWKLAGYFLLGLACLCKQSFVFMPLFVPFILGDWRRSRFWGAIFLPAVAYAVFLLVVDGTRDAAWQLTSRTGLLSAGFSQYLNVFMALGIAYALFAIWFAGPRGESADQPASRLTGRVDVWLLAIPCLVIVISLFAGIMYLNAFLLFGTVMGLALYCSRRENETARGNFQAASLALITAWSVSLSEGYNTPALAAGVLFVAALAFLLSRSSFKIDNWRPALAVAAGLTLLAWAFGRVNYVYRDRPAWQLGKQLGDVFPGGRLIKTNTNTYEFLADLRSAIATVEQSEKRYLIIPDVPGHWVKSRQPNPLPIAWPHGNEISNQRNFDRLIESLEAGRNTSIVIAQKVEATTLNTGFHPLPPNQYYAIVGYVRNRFTKVGETKFFELYR